MDILKNQYNNLATSYGDRFIFPAYGKGVAPLIIASGAFIFTWQLYEQMVAPYTYSKFKKVKKKDDENQAAKDPYKTKSGTILVSGTTFANCAYMPAFLTGLAMYAYFRSKNPNMDTKNIQYKQLIAPSVMFILHFLKRLLECRYVHVKSKDTNKPAGPLQTCLTIGFGYASEVGLSLYYQLLNGDNNNYVDTTKSFKIGATLYAIGEFGNFYHHYILRVERLNNKTGNKYVIPQGGLFPLCWCPHYLFEIMSWIGVAVTSRHLILYTVVTRTTGYLVGRAISTKKWYKEKFGDECPDRSAILPYIL